MKLSSAPPILKHGGQGGAYQGVNNETKYNYIDRKILLLGQTMN